MPLPLQRRFVIPLLPSAVALVSYYALAVHMYMSLGGWPESIGERGFPPALITHAYFSGLYFGLLVVGTMVVIPLAVLICGLVRKWRPVVPSLLISFVAFFACLAVMQLAPSRFVIWWWD